MRREGFVNIAFFLQVTFACDVIPEGQFKISLTQDRSGELQKLRTNPRNNDVCEFKTLNEKLKSAAFKAHVEQDGTWIGSMSGDSSLVFKLVMNGHSDGRPTLLLDGNSCITEGGHKNGQKVKFICTAIGDQKTGTDKESEQNEPESEGNEEDPYANNPYQVPATPTTSGKYDSLRRKGHFHLWEILLILIGPFLCLLIGFAVWYFRNFWANQDTNSDDGKFELDSSELALL